MSKEATVNALKYTLEHFKKHSVMAISCNDYFTTMLDDSLKLIESQPEVVMCKDCRHYDGYVCKHEVNVRSRKPDWYCADAWKRKDEK